MVYLMICTFRFYVNRKGALAQALGRYSYGVYIVHFVIMGALALVLLRVDLPSVAKYGILAVATFVCSNLAVAIYKAVRGRLDSLRASSRLAAEA